MDEQTSFNLTDLPLGSIAACDVSDEPMWTCQYGADGAGDESSNKLSEDQENALDAMRGICSKAETQARRLEIELAWKLRLMDRGFHYIYPGKNGGWLLNNPNDAPNTSPFAQADRKSQWPLNIIGAKNDILVSALTREVPRVLFFPKKPGEDASITAADAANKFKFFLADENCYPEKASEAARLFCTDDRVVFYMRPVADAQEFGYEDENVVVPENEDQGPETPSKRPRIRSVLSVFGKLEHKTQIVQNGKSPYEQIYEEIDVATARGMAPWIADKINGGDSGIAEVQLDRMARCSIKLALRGTYSTGDSLLRDVTIQRTWMRPEMYLDDSCPKEMRQFFFTNFPKGCLVVYLGKTFAYARNESPDEVLTVFHSRTGSGRNRRALTESYAGPNLRLNNWNELLDQSIRKGIPRTFYHHRVFNVPALRAAASNVGAIDPFDPDQATNPDPNALILQSPTAKVEAAIPDAIQYFAGPLAEELTGAQPAMAGSQDEDDPETLGQSRLQNAQAMGRLTEAYQSLRYGFANATLHGVTWAARVQPEGASFDRMIDGKRLRVSVSDMSADILACPEGDANIPESYEERKSWWTSLWAAAEANPNGPSAQFLANPINKAMFKQFMPPGAEMDGVASVEKQQGELEILLESAPMPNPDYQKLEMIVEQGTQEMQQNAAMQVPIDPQKAQALEQAQQQLQQTPQEISSVPLRPSDNDAIEAMVLNVWLNEAEGRKLANSTQPKDRAGYQNVVLHWQQHDAKAKQNAAQNMAGIPPKVSINVAADKLPPAAQTQALGKAGIVVPPADAEGSMQPHEQKIEQEHIDPLTGAKTKTTQAVMNPEH